MANTPDAGGATGEESDECVLPADTVAILMEFLSEQECRGKSGDVEEDWQLSQFWYTEETCRRLVEEAVLALGEEGTGIGCVSSPSLIEFFLHREEVSGGRVTLSLFEFDERFREKYPDRFVHYDYNRPLEVPDDLRSTFDVLLVDPPFISEECMVKVAQTVRVLSKPGARIIFCTGASMEELLYRLLKLRRAEFRPQHRRNLANEFSTYTNYSPSSL